MGEHLSTWYVFHHHVEVSVVLRGADTCDCSARHTHIRTRAAVMLVIVIYMCWQLTFIWLQLET